MIVTWFVTGTGEKTEIVPPLVFDGFEVAFTSYGIYGPLR